MRAFTWVLWMFFTPRFAVILPTALACWTDLIAAWRTVMLLDLMQVMIKCEPFSSALDPVQGKA